MTFPLARIWCRLWGCEVERDFPYCACCGADIYNDFAQRGYLWWVRESWWWLKALPARVTRRCDVCGRRMWFTDDPCCSEQCFSEWVPF